METISSGKQTGFVLTIVCISLSMLVYLGINFLMMIVPSMAVVDGVADPNRHDYALLILFYKIFPYLILLVLAIITRLKFTHIIFLSNVWYTGLSLLPFILFIILTMINLPVITIPWFWNMFPVLQMIAAIVVFIILKNKHTAET